MVRNMMKKLIETKWTGVVLAGAGILMMIFGIYRGEMSVVFTKAVKYLYGVYWNWIIRR